MSFDALMNAAQRLSTSMEALAALGAELRVRREGLFAAPLVRQLLQEVVHGIDLKILEGLTADQERTALAIIEGSFRHAIDLLENPARMPGWVYSDPVLLQGMGLRSKRFVPHIEVLASRQSELAEALKRPGALLDVGTGAGWLAIEAARSWPEWRVVGIDRWDPALELARSNVAAIPLEDIATKRRPSVARRSIACCAEADNGLLC